MGGLGDKESEVAPLDIDCVISDAARPCLILVLWECDEFAECEVVVALALVGMLFEEGGAAVSDSCQL